jgi:site-specific DNA-methyltransferase (adenine-specific)
MAQLIWNGKHAREQETFINSTIAPQHLCTYERFEGKPTAMLSNSILAPTQSWYNRLILGDKSAILLALLPEFAGQVNLIYIDPPFMTGRNFKNGVQLAFSDKWDNDLDIYLQWLYETFTLLKLLLTSNGSLYVHLDWRVTHYARVILDEVFGFKSGTDGPGFKNEIIWNYQSGGRSQKRFARKHDTILFYTKTAQYCFHGERIGERRGTKKRNHMKKWVDTEGHTHWTIQSAGRLYSYDEDSPMTPPDVWSDISHLHQKDPERNGYATQKPAALLERVIQASSEENDLVLDCFCGSGVTPAVAEQLGRRWIACDQSELAFKLTRERILTFDRVHPFVMQRLENNASEHII